MRPSEHYRAVRGSLTALAPTLTDGQLGRTVPGCPAWTVRELLSHLTGLASDLAAGRVEGAGTSPWTAVQVAERQGRSVGELLAEWAASAPAVEGVMDSLGQAGYRIFYDITLHDDDLREALGLPAGDLPAHRSVLTGMVGVAGGRITGAGLPALRLVAGEQSWTAGEGEPGATLTAPGRGELGRVLGARRTPEQVRALAWEGDPEPYLPLLPLFPPS